MAYTRDFCEADAFLAALDPAAPPGADEPRDWIFRGQEDARGATVPSAHRPSTTYLRLSSTYHP